MKHISIFAPVLAAFLVLSASAPLVYAAELKAGETVFISGDEPITENAYIAGGRVNIGSPAEKDLWVTGGNVVIDAPVSGDVAAAGGTVDIREPVAGDVRIAGGDITISKPVGGDVLVFGGSVTLLPGANVSGDLLVFGGEVSMEGSVTGSTKIYGGEVNVNATLTGPALMKAESVSFGEKTMIASSLSYSAREEATVLPGATLGEQVTFTPLEGKAEGKGKLAALALAIGAFFIAAKFVGMLATALILAYAFKRSSFALASDAVSRFWQKAAVGFVALIVTPVAMFLLMISGIGFYPGLILAALYLFALLVGGAYMGIIAGAFLSKWIRKEIQITWKWVTLGVVVSFLLAFIPIIGWLAAFLLFLASFGAVATSAWRDAKAKM